MKPRFFYGWYIVAVGFIANVASSFALASTLSIFLKPLTADLGISRGVFSLLRSGEGIIAACLAPLVGALVDRYGGRWLMVAGAAIVAVGYLILGQVASFVQFAAVRLTLVSCGDVLMGYMVVNVVVAQWFVRQRGRAFAFTSMGVGFAKVCMPILAAWLLLMLGWRQTWVVFGVLTAGLLIPPALLFVRRRPEEMGLNPDGDAEPAGADTTPQGKNSGAASSTRAADVAWTRSEALRTRAFWLLVITFGISSIGITGLNLHVFSYVTDIGHSPVVAASVMSVIASMQLASPLAWGLLAERVDARIAAMLRFVVQAIGLGLAILTGNLFCLYAGFFLYGIGLGGNMVLPDILWANYFGRRSLGRIRGMGLLISHVLAAIGPPFFGFLYDATGGYGLSFAIFGAVLIASAVLSLMLKPPRARGS
ncbi:MAG: MFS transporter [Deltaproteobacteria bacterium]|nr:MFS transporter [Deltaproteobacteria bacterium]MBI2534292.1 MFS transporter [Deltaproteobacteria bacterium]